MRETELTTKIIREIKRQGGWAIKTTGVSEAGTPDILGCLHGWMLAIEVKLPGNKPTPLQLVKLKAWESAGAIAFWTCDFNHAHDSLPRVQKNKSRSKKNTVISVKPS